VNVGMRINSKEKKQQKNKQSEKISYNFR